MSGWIAVKGRDAGAAYPRWINPSAVVSASWWTDRDNLRVLSLELVSGERVDLRERSAHDTVARLVGGASPAPEPAGCTRR